MQELQILGCTLQLLPEKAIYIEPLQTLLISDVHLGKSETFQAAGIPISSQVNQQTLERLQTLCLHYKPEKLIVLGDLFHSKRGLTEEVLEAWTKFLNTTSVHVQVLLGNHDRPLISTLNQFNIQSSTEAIQIPPLLLSHEPSPQPGFLNICGHVHPYVRLKTRLDNLRLPCFYLDRTQNLLILPPFGEFTGGYEVSAKRNTAAYVPIDDRVIAFD